MFLLFMLFLVVSEQVAASWGGGALRARKILLPLFVDRIGNLIEVPPIERDLVGRASDFSLSSTQGRQGGWITVWPLCAWLPLPCCPNPH